MGLCGSSDVGDGYAPVKRVLLLGMGGAGKSTLVKQVKLHHTKNFRDEKELRRLARDIHLMLFETLHVLAQREDVGKALGFEGRASSDSVFSLEAGGTAEEQREKLAWLVERYWQTEKVRKTLARVKAGSDNTSSLNSNEWVQYWIDESARVLADDFSPSNDDIMKLRRCTTGVHEQAFTVDGRGDFVLIDVGGQTAEMREWEEQLNSDLAGIIFIVNAADVDRVGENHATPLLDAFALLDNILDTTEAVQELPLVIMLNKADLFAEKLEAGVDFFRHMRSVASCRKKTVRSFAQTHNLGSQNPRDPELLLRWLAHELESTDTFIKSPHGKMSCFQTCATDISQAQKMIDLLIGCMVDTMLTDSGMMM